MPLIDHGVQNALRKAGLLKDPNAEPEDIQSQLNAEGLSVKELLTHLRDTIEGADKTSDKLRGIDTGFKLHGVLRDQTPPPPSVTIVIQDPESKNQIGLNPILVPRPTQVIPISKVS